jgi:hypothetical protein
MLNQVFTGVDVNSFSYNRVIITFVINKFTNTNNQKKQ